MTAALASTNPAALTGRDGRYRIPNMPDGDYYLREVMTPGYTQTYPGNTGSACDGHLITLPTTETYDFGNQPGADFGDAPSPYPTLLVNGGPSHGISGGFHLGPSVADGGAGIDGELDGFQDPDNPFVTDDSDNIDDEDGVIFLDAIGSGTTSTIQVTATSLGHPNGSPQRLD